MPTWIDTALVAAFAVASPAIELLRTPRLRAAIERGEPGSRRRYYRTIIVLLWAFTVAVLAWWLIAGRPLAGAGTAGVPLADLGLGLSSGWRLWLGGALALAAAVFLVLLQPSTIARNPQALAQVEEQLRTVGWFLPRGAAELKTFYALSVTAGICEEILYRGYLIWYLAALSNTWMAVVGSSVLFGLAHLYLGRAAGLRAGVTGLVLAGLYLFTGSLWPPIVLHAAVDLGSGRTAALLTPPPAASEETSKR